MAGFQIKKAKREKIYCKIALMAPSGGGKTYSALRLATGMAEEIFPVNLSKKLIICKLQQIPLGCLVNASIYQVRCISQSDFSGDNGTIGGKAPGKVGKRM